VIIESIITTTDPEGRVNVAPMGVEWGEETIVVKPFLETATFRNLRDTGVAVPDVPRRARARRGARGGLLLARARGARRR
jgi:hypothetical protein